MAILRFSFLQALCFLKCISVMRYAVKYIAALFCAMLLAVRPAMAQAPDSAAFRALEHKLDSYVKAIEPLDVHTQEEECSFLISSCTDSLVRQHVALYLYSHYIGSEVMDAEAVAIDIADKWFFSGKVRMKSDIDLMNAKIYADFNRQSLVGERAPELSLKDSDGKEIPLFGSDFQEHYSVLYFYDTGCPDCLVQTVMLRTFLDAWHRPLDVYAVYSGADSLAWKAYREKRLGVSSAQVTVHNLWDPELESDFQRKYGVLKTPQMFLIGKDNVILGRRLDVPALGLMLRNIYSSDDYEYGSQKSMEMFSGIFSSFGDSLCVEDINGLADRISERTAASPAAFKESVGDMFYYISTMQDGCYKEGTKYLADKYILSRPDIWDTAADSLKVVGYARTMSDLLSRAMPGSRVPDIRVRGVMAHGGKPCPAPDSVRRQKSWNLARLRHDTYVMFYDKDCGRCHENIRAAGLMLRMDRRMRVLFVRMSGGDMSSETQRLLDTFDMTVLPFILRIDGKGTVQERYVDFTRLAGNTFGRDGK